MPKIRTNPISTWRMTYKPSKRFSAEQLDFSFVRKFMPGSYRRTTNAKAKPANLVFGGPTWLNPMDGNLYAWHEERQRWVTVIGQQEMTWNADLKKAVPLEPANLVFSPIHPSVVERNPRYWVECDCGGLDEGCACGGSNGRAGRRLVSDYRV